MKPRFGIITLRKIKGGLAGIQSHVNREHKSHTNPDIDYNKSNNNYDIDGLKCDNISEKVNGRIKELDKTVTKTGKERKLRSDAVKLLDFVITASDISSWGFEKQKRYFKGALDFLRARYGKDNVIYAKVHMDEANPHMHVGIIPVKDKKLNCKSLINQKSLQDLQAKYYENVSVKYGLDKPVGGIKGLDTISYKRKKEEEKLQAIRFGIDNIGNEIENYSIIEKLAKEAPAKEFFSGKEYYKVRKEAVDELLRLAKIGIDRIGLEEEIRLEKDKTTEERKERIRLGEENGKLRLDNQYLYDDIIRHERMDKLAKKIILALADKLKDDHRITTLLYDPKDNYEDWLHDWYFMTEAQKDEEHLKKVYRDDY